MCGFGNETVLVVKQTLIAKQKYLHRRFVLRLATTSLLAVGAACGGMSVIAQDQDDQTDEVKPAQPDSPKTGDPKAGVPDDNKQLAKKTLYFIGPKVTSERQQGPSIGPPTSILPRPLVARGSVPVPLPAPQGAVTDENVPKKEVDAPTTEGAGLGGVAGQPDGDVSLPTDGFRLPGETPDLTDAGAAQTPDGSLGPDVGPGPDGGGGPDSVGGIQEGSLQRIDPSGLAVQGLANPIETVWQGYGRADIKIFLDQLAQPSFSPALTRLAGSIAGSGFSLPAPSGRDDILKIIEARLGVFEATANATAYVNLIEGLPSDGDWSALSRQFARVHLLKSELTDACLIAEAERERDADPYWLRLAAFCMAATGNRTGVDFQLGILEETTQVEPIFYQLLDQILIEAEQPPGAVLSERISIEGALHADILTVAMARLARTNVTAIAAKDLDPLAIPLLLENPSLSIEAQSMLVAFLIERGIGGGEAMAAFARSITLQDGEAQAALSFAAQATRVPAEHGRPGAAADQAQLTVAIPDTDSDAPVVDENRLQTTLLALIAGAGSDAQKIPAFNYFWQRAENSGKQAAIAPVIAALTQPGGFTERDQLTPDVRASLARSATLSGDEQRTNGWSRGLRTSVAGQNPDVDKALIALWPLLAVGEDQLAVNSANRLALWWQQQQAAGPQAFERANLLFSLTDAVGGTVPEGLWLTIADGPTAFDGVMISPALWRKFEINVQREDPLAALSSLYQLLSEVSPADLPPAISGVLISGLMRLGFEDTAKALALEILISQKL